MDRYKNVDRLAKYLLVAASIAIAAVIFVYFKNVIIYILLAMVISLIGKPIMELFEKVNIKGWKLPLWLSPIIAIIIIIGGFLFIITQIFPIVWGIANDISMANIENLAHSASVPLTKFNHFLQNMIPNLENDFRIERAGLDWVQNTFDISIVSSLVNSIAGFLVSFGVGLFSAVFISFFFLKDSTLFAKMISALVPEKHEKDTVSAIGDIHHLLSRYFVGIVIEVLGVALLNFLGLLLIARMGFNASIGIAFITALLNIIPYLGPLIGIALGTILSLILKYICITSLGLDVSFLLFTVIIIAILWGTQLVDNFLFQPIIYSNSIKANALEIFIVLLMASQIGGAVGMLLAIPAYTVIRVVAGRFFRHIKAIRLLVPNDNSEKSPK